MGPLSRDILSVRDVLIEYAADGKRLHQAQLRQLADILMDMAMTAQALEAQPIPRHLLGTDPRIRSIRSYIGVVESVA